MRMRMTMTMTAMAAAIPGRLPRGAVAMRGMGEWEADVAAVAQGRVMMEAVAALLSIAPTVSPLCA